MSVSFDASEINNWSDKPEASYKLPELIGRLTLATLPESPSRIDMPSGSSVRMPGWDGLLEVDQGNAWIPAGLSGWEMSCELEVTRKASSDYKKRTEEPLGLDMTTTTFVFVTSRRWSAKRKWEQERRQEGHWSNVRAFDSDDLVAWLGESPEVSRWFARVMGKQHFDFEAANRIEERQVETMETLTSGFGDLQAELATIRASLEGQAETADSGLELSEVQRRISNDLDTARNLLQQGLVIAARTQLQRIEKQSDELTEDLRFRLTSYMAKCAISEERIDDACSLLDESHRIQPDNPDAVANAALAAQLQDDAKRALELARKALELDRKNASAAATLMWALLRVDEHDLFENFVSSAEWVSQESTPALTLAGIRADQSHFEEAISIYRSLIDVDEEDAYAHLGLSHCLLTYAQVERVPAGFDTESQGRCEAAEAAASRAMELFQATQLRSRCFDALVLRAGARALLGNVDEAMRDVDAVLSQSPEHIAAMVHKGLILLQMDRPQEARVWFESVQEPGVYDELLLPLAEACLDSGDPDAAIDLLRDSYQLDPPEWEDVGRAEALLRAEAAKRCDDSLGAQLEAALTKHPDSPGLLLLTAIQSNLQGDTAAAEADLLRAADLASEPHREAIQAQIGNLYASVGRHADAAEQYKRSSGSEPSHPAAIPLLLSLSNCRRFDKVLELARKIRAVNVRAPRIAIEVEAEVLGYIGDVSTALDRYHELCSREDSEPDDEVKLALTQFRCGDRDGALDTVTNVDVTRLIPKPKALMRLAHLKRFLGASEYLEDAYLATQSARNDPDTQLGFFRMFLGRSDDGSEPESAVPGSVIRLRRDDDEQWWQLLESDRDSPGPRELLPSDPLTDRLLGRSVGDHIVLRQGLEDLSYEVTGLQSKYVREFQEISEEFSTRFPDNMALSRVEFDPQFSKLFESIDLRHQLVRNAEELYKSGQIPFASFAALVGRSILEIWSEYVMDPVARIRFAYGNEQEADASKKALGDCNDIVLDLMALLTVHKLGLADWLRREFDRVRIPQLVYDEIQEVVYAMRMDATPAAVMGKDEEGNYTRMEFDQQFVAERRRNLESILSLADSLDRIPSYPMLAVKEAQDYIDVLTSGGAGSVFAGEDDNGTRPVLVSDDLVQADVARSLGMKVVSSQAILVQLLDSESISDGEYSGMINEMVKMNYWFVRVRGDDIQQSLEDSAYSVTESTLAMLRTLEGPSCSDESAASVAAEVVASLAKKSVLRQIQENFLMTVLGVIRRGRHTDDVILRFKVEVAARLRLAPLQSAWILEFVDLYMQASRLRTDG
ncbi:MAG: hypothetical protein F4X83_02110 [Chloroflexi bacterium]|nr:hypothetical protein [Chloroflexota bacterium]